MKKYIVLAVLFLGLFVQNSCSDDAIDPEPIVSVDINNEINDFVWKGLNSEYYWQNNVPDLDNSKDNDKNSYFTYLNGYSDPEELFKSLLYKKGIEDRFSWFIDDYDVHNASFRGVSDSFGFDFGLAKTCTDCNEVIGYITYVVPNSPASDAGLKRGDIFYIFNGTELTATNYTVVNAFFTDTHISMEFATLENGVIVPKNKEVSLDIREVVENPVHYSDIITDEQGTKIGYLVYNRFRYTFHEELNSIFEEFKSQNIQELILDFRYNGGGTGITAAYLASMIYGRANTNSVFAKLVYNSKNSNENSTYPFFDTAYIYNKDGDYTGQDLIISKLSSLSKLYVITTDQTASASELIINGLSPYMQVITIGTTTYGKNVGSHTVYDSPDFSSKNINPNHKNAMQPITFKVFNKLDQSDYTQGFPPDHEVIEYASQIKPFGDLNEPLLMATLNIISGNVAKMEDLKDFHINTEKIFSSIDKKPFSKEMYILPE